MEYLLKLLPTDGDSAMKLAPRYAPRITQFPAFQRGSLTIPVCLAPLYHQNQMLLIVLLLLKNWE